MFGGVLSLTAGFAALNLAQFALAATGLAVEPNNWFSAEINLEATFREQGGSQFELILLFLSGSKHERLCLIPLHG